MAIYKLGDIISISMCKRISKNERSKKEGIPFYKIGTLGAQADEYISKEIFNEYKLKYRYPKINEVMITCSGSIGKVWTYDGSDCYFQDSNIIWLENDESKVLNAFLKYKMIKFDWNSISSGSTIKRLYNEALKKIKVELPSIKEQKKIIDIIEPIKNLLSATKALKDKLITILINRYKMVDDDFESLSRLISLSNKKYDNQIKYFATNAVGELSIDYTKIQSLIDNVPSRANLSPKENSFIISKLSGENKVLYFENKPKEVFSTGFFNFETKFNDHILGFILSNDFKMQKSQLSKGTTMTGINVSDLENIKIKKTINTSTELTLHLNKLVKLEKILNELINKTIKLLIK